MADDTPVDEPADAKPLEYAKSMEPEQNEPIEDYNKDKVQIKGYHKRTRRGYGKKNNKKYKKGIKNVKFLLMGTNANGLMGKQESLKNLINKFRPSVLTVQETKLARMGLIKLNGYQVFEKVRPGGLGGGLLTGQKLKTK